MGTNLCHTCILLHVYADFINKLLLLIFLWQLRLVVGGANSESEFMMNDSRQIYVDHKGIRRMAECAKERVERV